MTPARRHHWARLNATVRTIGARTEALASGYHDTHGAVVGREEQAESALKAQVRELAEAFGFTVTESKG